MVGHACTAHGEESIEVDVQHAVALQVVSARCSMGDDEWRGAHPDRVRAADDSSDSRRC